MVASYRMARCRLVVAHGTPQGHGAGVNEDTAGPEPRRLLGNHNTAVIAEPTPAPTTPHMLIAADGHTLSHARPPQF